MIGMVISSDEIREMGGSWVSEGCREAVGETLLIVQDMGQLLSSSLCVSKGIKSLWGCDRVRR